MLAIGSTCPYLLLIAALICLEADYHRTRFKIQPNPSHHALSRSSLARRPFPPFKARWANAITINANLSRAGILSIPNPSAFQMSGPNDYTSIIFDIGDVLFRWSPETKTSISSKTLHKILSSPTWFDYERGKLSEGDCYARVGEEFSLEPEEIRLAFQQARDSLQANEEFIALIRELKAQSNGQLRVFAMSNISVPDYEVLRTKPADWAIFDEIFTSGAAGERKPNLGFYRQVLAATGVEPRQTIFVDDKLENVLSARSLGMHGIVFENPEPVRRALRNLIGSPAERGKHFLEENAGRLLSVTAATDKLPAIELRENFAQLLILEATNDRYALASRLPFSLFHLFLQDACEPCRAPKDMEFFSRS